MKKSEARIAALGEVMVELSEAEGQAGCYRLAYAGDSFNTAVMLSRLGVQTHYVSLLGPDPLSEGIAQFAASEGLGTGGLLRADGGRPGLYLIRTDEGGERSFHYWRSDSVARQLLQCPQRTLQVSEYLKRFDYVYLSGITLAVIGMPAEKPFWWMIETLRASGVALLFDPNWRPALWPDRRLAQDAYRRLIAQCEWSFPTYQDERDLWGFGDVAEVFDFHTGLGVREVVLKCPQAEALTQIGRDRVSRRSAYLGKVVDTTGAGDAFNAGYIAARLSGADAGAALEAGHACAAGTLASRGAIPDRRPSADRAQDHAPQASRARFHPG